MAGAGPDVLRLCRVQEEVEEETRAVRLCSEVPLARKDWKGAVRHPEHRAGFVMLAKNCPAPVRRARNYPQEEGWFLPASRNCLHCGSSIARFRRVIGSQGFGTEY